MKDRPAKNPDLIAFSGRNDRQSVAHFSLQQISLMFGLRTKILLGFGGLLVILVTVSLLGETVLDRYGGAMRRTFTEDFQSVSACEDMNHAVDGIDTALQQHFWRGAEIKRADLDHWRDFFDKRLAGQRTAATLPGEKEATNQLAHLWIDYKTLYPRLLDESVPQEARKTEYARSGLPKAMEVQAAIHRLVAMNLGSMLSTHGSASSIANRAKWAMHMLTLSGAAMALLFALLIARFILQPVRMLTGSVRQIEKGNLDLTVPVTSRDELGTLAAAFNQMTAQLRAYRRAEQERLMRTEQTTQVAIDSLPDAVVVLNPSGRIEMANDTAKDLFGLSPGTEIAKLQKPWLTELHRRVLLTQDAPLAEGYEATIQVEDQGEARWFLPRTVPICDADRKLIGLTLVLADVTGLRRLDEMKNGLLSMVSHELKTPLTSMRMVLHLITEQKVGALSDKQKELLSAARDDSERLHQIVENLLDMGRIESGKALMDLQPVAPRQLLERAAQAVGGAFEAQQVTLQIEASADLAPVMADAMRIGHVLGNLLSNSLRYTEPHGHVTLSARAQEDWVEFSVSDDGAGIPRQYLPRVFEKFFRAPGQVGGSGSGLGLSIAKDIVEAHGGKIRVQSIEGRGTTFAFTLRQAGAVTALPHGPSASGSRELSNGFESGIRLHPEPGRSVDLQPKEKAGEIAASVGGG
jgi:NtrC-family two-component system sensor histidine kinase KinB